MADEVELVTVHTLTNRFESDLLMNALEREGIPALLRSFEETPYNGLFVSQRGWGQILVPKEYLAQSREIVAALLIAQRTEDIYEDPSDIDPLLWEQLEQAPPETTCEKALVKYDPAAEGYEATFMSGKFHIFTAQRLIEPFETAFPYKLSFQFYLVMLHYLLEARTEPVSGKWVSEKELPGGRFFFRGPHMLPTDYILRHMDSDLGRFQKAAEILKGTPVKAGDIAYRFQVLPRIPLLFIFWKGDDEFEPALHIRFDSSITAHLNALDTIWAMVNVVAKSLVDAISYSV